MLRIASLTLLLAFCWHVLVLRSLRYEGPRATLSTRMGAEGAQTSLVWTLLGTQAKLRPSRTDPCTLGEPFGPDSARAGGHGGPLEKALSMNAGQTLSGHDWGVV